MIFLSLDDLESAISIRVNTDLAGGFPCAAVLSPVTLVVDSKTVAEVGVLAPAGAGTMLGPLVAPEFGVGLVVLRAREPDGGHLGEEVVDRGGIVGRSGAVGGVLVLGVLRPQSVDGVRTRAVALLESKKEVDGLGRLSGGRGSDGNQGSDEDQGNSSDESARHFCCVVVVFESREK